MTNDKITEKKYDVTTLPPTTLRIFIEFYRMCPKDEEITISIDDIASRMDMAKSTVRQHLKTLETSDFILSVENFDELGRHKPKTYSLLVSFGDFMNKLFRPQA